MSLKTWKREFYPVAAIKATGSDLEAAEHSLRKWQGLTKENLERHKVGAEPVTIGYQTCALCRRYPDDCSACPLDRYSHECSGFGPNPFADWCDTGDPKPMIAALRKALRLVKKRAAK